MSEYDQNFDPNIIIGHCDLISRFSDFALYLGTKVVYEQTSFTLYRPPSLSRNQGEWGKHREFSEVRDKQIETKKLNSLTLPN